MYRHLSHERMETVRVVMVLLLVIGAVEMKKPVKSETSSELTLESFMANLDYTTFKTFQQSIEEQMGLKPGTANTQEFRDYYEKRTTASKSLEPQMETTALTGQLASMFCALCIQENLPDCHIYCNTADGI